MVVVVVVVFLLGIAVWIQKDFEFRRIVRKFRKIFPAEDKINRTKEYLDITHQPLPKLGVTRSG